MAHDHHHHGEGLRDYFTEQLLTILVCGLFGFAAIQLYRTGMLQYVLAEQFRFWVYLGGIGLLVLVVVRAVAVWREAGEAHAHAHEHHHGHDHHHDHAHHHDHNHDHGHHHHDHEHHQHDHGHDHAHHDHQHHAHEPGADDHGHSHDLAWVFSRLLVLCFPVGLFLIGVPNSGFSQDRIRFLLGCDDALTGNMAAVAHRNGTVMSFNELNDAANDEEKRESLQGQTAVLEGRVRWIDARQFTLFRLKMTCCAADVVPLKVRIVLKRGTLSGLPDFSWVQMKGQIQFVQAPNSERYIPVIVVEDIRDIRRTEPKNEYD